MKIVIDADYLAYAAAAACETRQIEVLHKPTNKVKVFKNRQEFYGKKRDKSEGWLGQARIEKNAAFPLEDFEIKDVQIAPELSVAKKIADAKINSILSKCKFNEFTDTFQLYLGEGDTFRHKRATLLEYKGNRENLLKPLLLKPVREYLKTKHDAILVEGIEADDQVNIEGLSGYLQWSETKDDDDKCIVVSIDKDARAGPMWLFNPDVDTAPKLIEGFGSLYVDPKGKIKGEGRIFMWFQILYGDDIDNYRSTCACDARFGPKGAFDILSACTTDKEALTAIVQQYKTWYPEPKKVKGWRGDVIQIDWLYVLEEIAALATMLPQENFDFSIKRILDAHKVSY